MNACTEIPCCSHCRHKLLILNFFRKDSRLKLSNSYIYSKSDNNEELTYFQRESPPLLFQTVEVSVHEACFDVHPGMSAGKKGLTGKKRKDKFDFLHIDQGH